MRRHIAISQSEGPNYSRIRIQGSSHLLCSALILVHATSLGTTRLRLIGEFVDFWAAATVLNSHRRVMFASSI